MTEAQAIFTLVLAIIPVALTISMFQSKSFMLGFPCLIFWAILSGHFYQLSTTTWDIYYLAFFGSIGMAIFCAFAAYGLRTKKEEKQVGDELIDEGKDTTKFIDEGETEEEGIGRRAKAVRERAARRRKFGIKKPLRLD